MSNHSTVSYSSSGLPVRYFIKLHVKKAKLLYV